MQTVLSFLKAMSLVYCYPYFINEETEVQRDLSLSALSVYVCRRAEHRSCCDEPNTYVPVPMGAYKSHGTHRPYTSKPQTHAHTTYKEGTGFGEREYTRRRERSYGQGRLL